MKKILILLSLFLIVSCKDDLNLPIVETLPIEDLKNQIKKDSTFYHVYEYSQEIRTWILSSDLRQAKWSDITYRQFDDFMKEIRDTSFQNSTYARIKNEYLKEYKSIDEYRSQVDSIINYWSNYQKENQLSNYVSVHFDELWKQYYSYSGDVKTVNVGFKVVPLKGKIDQLIFRYQMKTKISNDGTIDFLEGHRCVLSRPVKSQDTFYWEADYSDEKKLKDKTTNQVKEEFDFVIEIEEVRINGQNISDRLELIPRSVKYCLEGTVYDFYYADIIKEFLDKDYISLDEFSIPKFKEAYQSIDPIVFELLDEYEHSKDSDEE